MFRDLHLDNPLIGLSLATLFLFFGLYAVAFFRAYARKAFTYDHVARLPLDEEHDHE